MWTVVDLEDLERILNFPYTWHSYNKEAIGNNYYAMATEHLGYDENHIWHSRTVYLNVFILNPDNIPNIKVYHINHDTLDNRKSNLRLASQKKNLKHRSGRNKNNVSGYRNVTYLPYRKKTPYHVQLQINGKNTVLGRFSDVDEAGAFAEEMRQKYYGEFAGKG